MYLFVYYHNFIIHLSLVSSLSLICNLVSFSFASQCLGFGFWGLSQFENNPILVIFSTHIFFSILLILQISTDLFPMSGLLKFINRLPCKGLVKKSADIRCVRQYCINTSFFSTLPLTKNSLRQCVWSYQYTFVLFLIKLWLSCLVVLCFSVIPPKNHKTPKPQNPMTIVEFR